MNDIILDADSKKELCKEQSNKLKCSGDDKDGVEIHVNGGALEQTAKFCYLVVDTDKLVYMEVKVSLKTRQETKV